MHVQLLHQSFLTGCQRYSIHIHKVYHRESARNVNRLSSFYKAGSRVANLILLLRQEKEIGEEDIVRNGKVSAEEAMAEGGAE
jgi:hypothetical protein